MQEFFWKIGQDTGAQLAAVLGFFMVLGFILSFLQRFTQRQYYESIGWLGILWTAWIGTPVHELSHWLAAKIFRHHIDSLSLFKPNFASGKLGEVIHSYNPRNPYHQIGNFFIGAAPIIGGVVVLSLLFRWLLPNGQELLNQISTLQLPNLPKLFTDIFHLTTNLFSSENMQSWRFWLFIYLSFAVSSHLAPSWADQKTMWRGFVWLALTLFITNAILAWLQKPLPANFTYTSLPFLVWAFWYAVIVSSLHALVSVVIFWPFKRR